MAKAKTVAETVDMPEGLDVIPTVPGTYVGGHDVQGADGTPRSDRPGEILGTPAKLDAGTASHQAAARDKETAKHDHIVEAVDRNNREVLPLLGGDIDDAWEPTETKVEVPAGIEAQKAGS
jgi:hypothetical protein